eukprot:g853.t2
MGSYGDLRRAVQAQLQQKFRPEFLNRIDELLVFQALSETQLTQIVQLILGDAQSRAINAFEEAALQHGSPERLEITWTADLEQLVIAKGSNVSYGARPLRRAVQRLFEDPLAEFLVAGDLKSGGAVLVDVEDGQVVLRYDGRTLRPVCTAKEVAEMPKVMQSALNQAAPENSNVPVSAVSVPLGRQQPRGAWWTFCAGSFTCFLTGFTYTFGEWSPVVKSSFRYSQAPVLRTVEPPEEAHGAAAQTGTEVDEQGRSTLHRAAEDGDMEEVEGLLAAGADIEAKDKEGNRPLHLAARKGHLAVVHGLLAANATVDSRNELGRESWRIGRSKAQATAETEQKVMAPILRPVHVALHSGRGVPCGHWPERRVNELREEAQQKLGVKIRELITNTGKPLPEPATLEEAGINIGDFVTALAMVPEDPAEPPQTALQLRLRHLDQKNSPVLMNLHLQMIEAVRRQLDDQPQILANLHLPRRRMLQTAAAAG